MKPQLSIEAFADWCEKQPAGREYDYLTDYAECACGQYAASMGIGAEAWIDAAIDGSSLFWGEANAMACNRPWTFGALAARLRAAQ